MAKSKLLQQLQLELGERSYPILIGENLLHDKGFWHKLVTSKQVMIISNTVVAPLYLSGLQAIFADRQCDIVILEDGEQYKNQDSLQTIYDTLVNNGHHRDTTLIALGGGVVGDICGFAASTYQRGVAFVQVPTSLLAQVDASVGGKTAINHPRAKNMIGSFYQPRAVVIDVTTLQSLPEREFSAGFAEIIKYGMLAGGSCLQLIQDILSTKIQSEMDNKQLSQLILVCCQIKADFVAADEREEGQRALLNLGHTVGHALESYTHYQRWLHGEAVAIGMYCAALISQEVTGFTQQEVDLLEQLLIQAGLPHKIPVSIDLHQLQILMGSDKKIKNNTLRFILLRKIGDCYIDSTVTNTSLQKALKCAVEGE